MSKELDRPEWLRRVGSMIELVPLTPGRGRVIVARDPSDSVLSVEADLVRSDKYKEVPQTGTIVALGACRENAMGTPVDFVYALGDRVIIHQIAGKRLIWNGMEMAVLDEDDVVTRINPMQR